MSCIVFVWSVTFLIGMLVVSHFFFNFLCEIDEMEILKIERINKSKICFFKKTNKINTPLSSLLREKREYKNRQD